MSKPLIIIGGGGHARVLIDALLLDRQIITAIIDPTLFGKTRQYLGISVLERDKEVINYSPLDYEVVIGLGSLPHSTRRKQLFDEFKSLNYQIKTVIHPSCILGHNVTLYEGAQIMAGVIIQNNTSIGENTIINTKASIDHDCNIGSHCHIAPGVTISGEVVVESDCHLGTGASIINGISIGNNCVVGAGAVVTKNLERNCILYPARGNIKAR